MSHFSLRVCPNDLKVEGFRKPAPLLLLIGLAEQGLYEHASVQSGGAVLVRINGTERNRYALFSLIFLRTGSS